MSIKLKVLDILFSKLVRKRDGSCLRCGKRETLQCSHVMPRTYLSVRWLPENAITLCYSCHIHWWHKYPHEAVAWFDEKFPGRYQKIRELANQHIKVDREETLKELKISYENLQNDWILD
jgi:hypothetical protein